jgi:hypothetical protein
MEFSHAKGGVKQKVMHELRRFLAIFAYLLLFFLLFRIYTRLVLSEYQINFVVYGLVFLKSLALAKVVLTGEALRFGERFRDRPLIFPTLYQAAVFCAFAFVFEVVEHLVLGLFHHEDVTRALADFFEKGWAHIVSRTLVVFVAFLPFFAFREMERAVGEGKLQELFFGHGAPPAAEEPPEGGAPR